MEKLTSAEAFDLVREHLSDDLRRPIYQGHPNKYRGHCYVAVEALYHLAAKREGFKPHVISKLEAGDTHWFLKNKAGTILDPTAEQFIDLDYTFYALGRGCGFMTKKPSKRAQELIARVRKHYHG